LQLPHIFTFTGLSRNGNQLHQIRATFPGFLLQNPQTIIEVNEVIQDTGIKKVMTREEPAQKWGVFLSCDELTYICHTIPQFYEYL
jgi:hypothetical protein